MAESINANSYKHKLNERNFLKGLEETKVTSQTGNLFSDHDILITEHVSREDEKFKSEEDIMNIRSDNPSILDQHY